MQKQKAGKKKNICICSRDDLTVPDWKIFWLVRAAVKWGSYPGITAYNSRKSACCHFHISGGYRSGKCSFRFAGDQFCNPCGTAVWSGVGDDLLYSCSYFGSSCSFSLRQIFSERYSRGSCQKNPYLRRLTVDETGKNRSGS